MKIPASARMWLAVTVLPAPLHAQQDSDASDFQRQPSGARYRSRHALPPNTVNNIGPSTDPWFRIVTPALVQS